MRVILLSTHPGDKAFFEGAAQLAGFPFSIAPSPDKVCEEILKSAEALLIVDASTKEGYQAFEKAVVEKVGLFSDVVNPNNIFLVASCDLHEAPYLFQSEIFGHFIHRSYSVADQELIGRLFKQAANDRAFGIQNYFGPQARSQALQITKSSQKNAVAESLKNHLLKIGFKSRMAAIIATAVDELIMNAIFDAPVDELGKRIYSQTPRSTELELAGKSVVEVKIIFDGRLLGVSVLDQHGSLDRKKLLHQHLGKSYANKEYEAKSVTGAGAGLGLSHVFRNCGGIIFSCEMGGKTEVTIFYKKTDSFKDFKDQFRFLSTLIYFA